MSATHVAGTPHACSICVVSATMMLSATSLERSPSTVTCQPTSSNERRALCPGCGCDGRPSPRRPRTSNHGARGPAPCRRHGSTTMCRGRVGGSGTRACDQHVGMLVGRPGPLLPDTSAAQPARRSGTPLTAVTVSHPSWLHSVNDGVLVWPARSHAARSGRYARSRRLRTCRMARS